jgi:hypothetical protein
MPVCIRNTQGPISLLERPRRYQLHLERLISRRASLLSGNGPQYNTVVQQERQQYNRTSLNLLIAVIVGNALKAICFICTLRATSFYPLVTVGDAVASFLDRPDPTTVACGPLSAMIVEDWGNTFYKIPGPWSEKVKHWGKAYVWESEKKGRTWGHAVYIAFGVLIATL